MMGEKIKSTVSIFRESRTYLFRDCKFSGYSYYTKRCSSHEIDYAADDNNYDFSLVHYAVSRYGNSFVIPFQSSRGMAPWEFEDYIRLGFPNPNRFGKPYLTSKMLEIMVIVAKEYCVPRGDDDTLYAMMKLSGKLTKMEN